MKVSPMYRFKAYGPEDRNSEVSFDLTENQKEWLSNLLSEEIDQSLGAADNESLWALGAPNEEQSDMHSENAEENRNYAELLKMIKEVINYAD